MSCLDHVWGEYAGVFESMRTEENIKFTSSNNVVRTLKMISHSKDVVVICGVNEMGSLEPLSDRYTLRYTKLTDEQNGLPVLYEQKSRTPLLGTIALSWNTCSELFFDELSLVKFKRTNNVILRPGAPLVTRS
jgi:hypothetical protein